MFVTHYFTNSKWRKKKRICMLSLLCWILKKRQLHNSYCNCSWGTKAIQMFGMWFKFSKERRINKTHHVLSSRFYKLDNIENRFIFNQLNSKTSMYVPNFSWFFCFYLPFFRKLLKISFLWDNQEVVLPLFCLFWF